MIHRYFSLQSTFQALLFTVVGVGKMMMATGRIVVVIVVVVVVLKQNRVYRKTARNILLLLVIIIVSVVVVGVQRHVGHHRQVGRGGLDGADGAVGDVVGVPGLGAILGLERRIGIGKDADRGDAKGRGLFRGPNRPVNRLARHTRH